MFEHHCVSISVTLYGYHNSLTLIIVRHHYFSNAAYLRTPLATVRLLVSSYCTAPYSIRTTSYIDTVRPVINSVRLFPIPLYEHSYITIRHSFIIVRISPNTVRIASGHRTAIPRTATPHLTCFSVRAATPVNFPIRTKSILAHIRSFSC